MTGRDLYNLWEEANSELGIGVDSWDAIGDDQQVWESLAVKLDRE